MIHSSLGIIRNVGPKVEKEVTNSLDQYFAHYAPRLKNSPSVNLQKGRPFYSYAEAFDYLQIKQREWEVILLRSESLTLEEIGKRLGITRERVRQIISKVFRRFESNYSFFYPLLVFFSKNSGLLWKPFPDLSLENIPAHLSKIYNKFHDQKSTREMLQNSFIFLDCPLT